MKTTILSCLLAAFILLPCFTFATHNRAGEIIFSFTGSNTIQASIITYTKQSSIAADRDSLVINWGDGREEVIYRTNGPLGASNIPNGQPLGNDIKKNIYSAAHTFQSGAALYIISMADANRNAGISNINNSVDVPFYIEDTIWMHGQAGNHSPQLIYPPIDFASVGDTFFHNPTAYDVEADSMTFELVKPLQGPGSPVPGYYSPEQDQHTPGDTITIDRYNGLITWAVPRITGIYTIAIKIREYRYGMLLSTLIRDMQIIVQAGALMHAPLTGSFADTTITPGQTLLLGYSVPNTASGRTNHLTAICGPLLVNSVTCTFMASTGAQPAGVLEWTPGHNLYKPRETTIVNICTHTDDAVPLVTQRSFRVTVIDSTVTTGVNEAGAIDHMVQAAPVPASDHIHISARQPFIEITIYTIDGKKVWQYDDMPATDTDIDIRSLSDGEYILITKGNNSTDHMPFTICR